MSNTINSELFTQNLKALLEETFENVKGIYLDGGTSLTETLSSLSAEEASKPIVPEGTSIAGQVEHIRFYLNVMNGYMDGQWFEKLDWKQSWLTKSVTKGEWETIRQNLKADYEQLCQHLQRFDDFNDDRRLGGALATIVHTAYHLGAIRQIMHLAKKQ